MHSFRSACRAVSALLATALCTCAVAQPIAAKHKQGSVHGFVVLKDEAGKLIATGDQVNVQSGNRIRSSLVLRFRDGSIDDERTIYTQTGSFRVLSDHHIQRGPSFKEPIDVAFDSATGTVTSHSSKDGKVEEKIDHMDLPPDIADGILAVVLQNMPAGATEIKVPYLAGGSKPRLVKLAIKQEGKDSFRIGGLRREATRYNIHFELGGVAGVVAPVMGKQPGDISAWLLGGEVPTLLRVRGPLYAQGPVWTMELASPAWPAEDTQR